MTQYFVKIKGWKYDFQYKGQRYQGHWYQSKIDAKQAEIERREALANFHTAYRQPSVFFFRDLVEKYLEYLEDRKSERHFKDVRYYANAWVRKWGNLDCKEITREMIEEHLRLRKKEKSSYTANRNLTFLRAMFNHGMKRRVPWVKANPTDRIPFYPVEKKIQYVPTKSDFFRIVKVATQEEQDYLWTIVLTMARVGEINQLKWKDVDLENQRLHLYTRKKRDGSLTPRVISMGSKLLRILTRRYEKRKKSIPWIFWHRYYSRKEQKMVIGPYQDRKALMRNLCNKAGVKYFRFHPLRHMGASILEAKNTPITDIQEILGHESRKTTEIYLHSIGASTTKAIKSLDSAFDELTD